MEAVRKAIEAAVFAGAARCAARHDQESASVWESVADYHSAKAEQALRIALGLAPETVQ